MSTEQCWSFQFDSRRCVEPAVPPTHFCAEHNRRGGGTNPLSIWRAPEAEMPPELVAAIRRVAPGATFPPPASAPDRASEPGDSEGGLTPSESRPSPAGTPCLEYPHPSVTDADPDDMEWLRTTLRQTMTEVAQSEAPPLQKANAVARLAGLYLKAGQVAELKRSNKELTRRLAAAEGQLAELEERAAAPTGPTAEPPSPQPLMQTERASAADTSPLGSMAGAPLPLRDPSRSLAGPVGPAGGGPADAPDGLTTIPERVPAGRGAPP